MNHRMPISRNRSPSGWWVGSYVQQAIWDDDPNPAPHKRCTAWENTIILQASDREIAYSKMRKYCKGGTSFFSQDGKRRGRWVFVGISELLPIYEDLEDGAEIIWKEFRNKSIKTIRSLVKKKEDLAIFNDK